MQRRGSVRRHACKFVREVGCLLERHLVRRLSHLRANHPACGVLVVLFLGGLRCIKLLKWRLVLDIAGPDHLTLLLPLVELKKFIPRSQ